jgi:hypothetical protein
MKVKDISFKDYLSSEDQETYDYYLNYGKIEPQDTLEIGPFLDHTFEFVKDMQYYCSVGLDWETFLKSMSEVLEKDIKELSNLSLFELQKNRLYCIEEVKKINKIESENLGHDITIEEEQADIARFGSYGAFIQFDKLADGNILKFEKIKKLKYDLCFTKLKLEADRDSFMHDYNKIMVKKNK